MEQVTIGIPCYNGGKYIDKCFSSIKNLNYDLNLIKIIFINDGSKDQTLKLVNNYKKEYGNRLTIITQKNSGLEYSRGVIIKNTKTKWLMFLDIDDTLPPNSINYLLKKTVTDPDLVIGKYYKNIKGKNKKTDWYICLPKANNNFKFFLRAMPLSYFPAWNKLWNVDSLKEVKWDYSKTKNMTYMEDIFQNSFCYTKFNKISFTNKYVYSYRQDNESSNSSKVNPINDSKNLEMINNYFLLIDQWIKTKTKIEDLNDNSSIVFLNATRAVIYTLYNNYIKYYNDRKQKILEEQYHKMLDIVYNKLCQLKLNVFVVDYLTYKLNIWMKVCYKKVFQYFIKKYR